MYKLEKWKKKPNAKSIEERFWTKVDIKHPDECWIWKAGKGSKGENDYGYFSKGKETFAHRVSYILTYGPIPQGLYVLHNCDTPSCVNPYHLRLGTHIDNVRDMIDRDRYYNSNKTHCKRGHEFTPENTYTNKDGGRSCVECSKIRYLKTKGASNG